MRFYFILVFSLPFFIMGCSPEVPHNPKTPKKTEITPPSQFITENSAKKMPQRATAPSVIKKASLRDELPNTVLAYLRIPNPWGYLTSTNQAGLNKALSDKVNVEEVKSLLSSTQQLFPFNKEEVPPSLHLFAARLNSPLELAVIPSKNKQLPIPKLLVRMSIEPTSRKEANLLLEKVIEEVPVYKLVRPFSKTNPALVKLGPAPLYLDFNPTTGVINGLIQKEKNPNVKAYFKTLVTNQAAPFKTLENEIDESGNGLFAWLDIETIIKKYSAMIPPNRIQVLQMTGLMDAQAVALGIGTAQKKGRIKLVVEIPNRGMRQLLPSITNTFDLETAGQPQNVISLSLPDQKYMKQMERLMLVKLEDDQEVNDYQEINRQVKEKTGHNIVELFDIIGPEVLFFEDEIGSFFGLHLRDKAQFYDILKRLEQAFGTEFVLESGVTKSFGVDIHFFNGDSFQSAVLKNDKTLDKKSAQPWLKQLMTGSKIHLFWIESGDNLIFSTVPQNLVDHAKHAHKVRLSHWLKEQQKQQPKHALALISANIKKSPEKSYYAYLQMLMAINDFIGGNLDIYHFPTAKMLGLPEKGSMGLQIDASDSRLSASLNYEQYPFESFYAGNGGMETIAIVGILAAVALPAYKDYIERAEASGAMLSISAGKATAEKLLKQGKETRKVSDIGLKSKSKYCRSIRVDLRQEKNSTISCTMKKGHVISWTRNAKTKKWHCKTSLSRKYKPQACRY